MPELERQVVEALLPDCPVDFEWWLRNRLAPRVAAAIDRLARLYVDDVRGGTDDSKAYQRVLKARQEDALAMLRGDTG